MQYKYPTRDRWNSIVQISRLLDSLQTQKYLYLSHNVNHSFPSDLLQPAGVKDYCWVKDESEGVVAPHRHGGCGSTDTLLLGSCTHIFKRVIQHTFIPTFFLKLQL